MINQNVNILQIKYHTNLKFSKYNDEILKNKSKVGVIMIEGNIKN